MMIASTVSNLRDSNGLCLLSLDGGGVRGLSSLCILRDIMVQLNAERSDEEHLKPCDVFDLIGGTSTGGLIAIMLGRLEMDVDECIAAYTQLMESVFCDKVNNLPVGWSGNIKAQYDSKRLKTAIEAVITSAGASPEDALNDGKSRRCRVFVCTTAKDTLQITRLRSYPVTNEDTLPATICEAALATAAATRFFEPVTIGNRQFVDGAFGANNPIEEVEEEAADIWCPTSRDLKPLVKCILSVGTGDPGQKALDDNIFQFMTKTLVRMATKPEGTERRFIARWTKEFAGKRYFRFNVEQGLQDVRLNEYNKRGLIESATHDYLHHASQKSRIRDCILNLAEKEEKTGLDFEETMREFTAHVLRQEYLKRTQSRNLFIASKLPAWEVPFERNPRFVDRDSLSQLKRKLFTKNRPQKMAVYGLGGVGKTQVALELAYATRERWPECSVFWIPAMNRDSLQQAYQNIAYKLGISQADHEEDVKTLVGKHLSQGHAGPWLLIFDNADDVDLWVESESSSQESLKSCLPRSDQGVIIFTTRSKRVAHHLASTEITEILEMDEQKATSVLRNCLINKSLLEDIQNTKDLLQRLTYLPLAIVQAASFINENNVDLASYVRLLDGQEQDAIDLLSEDFEDEGRYKSIRNPVATTWLASFTHVEKQCPLAAEYLSLMACMNSADIPIMLLPAPSSLEHERAIGTLGSYAFVRVRHKEMFLDMHRLVHLAMRNKLKSAQELHRWQSDTAALLIRQIPGWLEAPKETSAAFWRAAGSHAIQLLQSTADDQMNLTWSELAYQVTECLMADGRAREAEGYCLLAIDIADRHQAGEALRARNRYTLALVYDANGRHEKAVEIGEQCLRDHKQLFGEDHPLTARVISGLSNFNYQLGRLQQAEELCRQSLKYNLKTWGPSHHLTLSGMNNLAQNFILQGQLRNAQDLCQQLTVILEKRFGPDNEPTLHVCASLAALYYEQWRLKEAADLGMKVVKGYEKLHGLEHPHTVTHLVFLAVVWKDQRRDADAVDLMNECYRLREHLLGPDHHSTKECKAFLDVWSVRQPMVWRVIYRYTLYRRHEMVMRRRQKYPKVKCYGGLYRARRQPLQDALLDEIKQAVKSMPMAKYGSSDEVTLAGSEEKKKWKGCSSWD